MKIIQLFIYLFPFIIFSQKNDYVWLLGYDYSLVPNDTFGISVMDFNTQSLNPTIYFDKNIKFDYSGTSVCMSDETGKYIFTTDGNAILNSTHEFMKNGKNISPLDNLHSELDPQSCIVLPTSKKGFYSLINNRIEIVGLSIASIQSFITIIDMNRDNGLGEVVHRLIEFSKDTLTLEKLISTRHANGKDWWLPIPGYNTNCIFTFLVQDTSISLIRKQKVDSIIYNGYGQAAFSPDGKYYANISSVSDQAGTYIYLYGFDRCSGLFSAIKQFHINEALYHVGVAFSPNSKIFYFTFWPYIFQIDLLSQDKKIDTLAKNDYYIEDIGGGFRRFNPFGFMQLGPDNRLYCVPNTESRNMHVITRPNILGSGAELRQHILKFASLHQTLPMHPNFRLGPIDGSSCDTLGIDNIPIAEFRYDQDTINFLKIDFTNLSWYEPTEFWWDWGDQSAFYYTTQKDTSICHTFAKEGVYQVCLRAKNGNGENTICKEIKLGTVGTNIFDKGGVDLSFYPNPAFDYCVVNIEEYLPKSMMISFIDIYGNSLLSRRLVQGSNFINIESLNPGVYQLEIKEKVEIIRTAKLIKM